MSIVLVLSIHEIISPENYKFFKGVVPMDKITHQVRAEHWTKIMNECINSGMSKTAWCRANGISEKQFFYWQRILRREAFENSWNSSLPATVGPHQELAPATQRTVSFTEIKLPSSSQSSRGDFFSPLTPPYMPFGIRRFNITSKHDAHCNNQDSL